MRFVMVNADERFLQCKREGLRGFEADEQRVGNPGLAWRQRRQFVLRKFRLVQGGLRDGQKIFQMSRAASSGTTPPYSA